MRETINNLTNIYNETMWNKFAKCFHDFETDDEILNKVPSDIVNVLVHILGYEQSKKWVAEKIPDLDYNTVIDLVKSEKGIKAVKMYVLSMPN